MDFYSVLGIQKSASKEEIKKAYRKLSLQFHPDKNPDNIEQSKKRFQELTEAFETLSDDDKRRFYDTGNSQSGNMSNINIFEIFNRFGMFGMKDERPNLDINIPAHMSLATSYKGEYVKHTIKVKRACETCKHTGYMDFFDHNCKFCKNTGYIQKNINMGIFNQQFRTNCHMCTPGEFRHLICKSCNGLKTVDADYNIDMFIPAGIFNGQTLTLNEVGNHDIYEGNIIKGNININITVNTDQNFNRIGNDLYSTLNLTLREALCGFSKKFTNIDGSLVDLTNNTVLNNEDILVVNHLGFVYDKIHKGNLCLKIKIERLDKNFTNEEREILEKILNL